MHNALGRVFSLEDSAPVAPTIVDCDMLRQYAAEAEVWTLHSLYALHTYCSYKLKTGYKFLQSVKVVQIELQHALKLNPTKNTARHFTHTCTVCMSCLMSYVISFMCIL